MGGSELYIIGLNAQRNSKTVGEEGLSTERFTQENG
jgi:hypothetical protein